MAVICKLGHIIQVGAGGLATLVREPHNGSIEDHAGTWAVMEANGIVTCIDAEWFRDNEPIVGHVADWIQAACRGLCRGAVVGPRATDKLLGRDMHGQSVLRGDWLRDSQTGYVMRADSVSGDSSEYVCAPFSVHKVGFYAIPMERAALFEPGSQYVFGVDICPRDREAYDACMEEALSPAREAYRDAVARGYITPKSDVFDSIEEWL